MTNYEHKIQEVLENEEKLNAIFDCATAEDAQKKFNEFGVQLTIDEVIDFGKKIKTISDSKENISELDLESISGGFSFFNAAGFGMKYIRKILDYYPRRPMYQPRPWWF